MLQLQDVHPLRALFDLGNVRTGATYRQVCGGLPPFLGSMKYPQSVANGEELRGVQQRMHQSHQQMEEHSANFAALVRAVAAQRELEIVRGRLQGRRVETFWIGGDVRGLQEREVVVSGTAQGNMGTLFPRGRFAIVDYNPDHVLMRVGFIGEGYFLLRQHDPVVFSSQPPAAVPSDVADLLKREVVLAAQAAAVEDFVRTASAAVIRYQKSRQELQSLIDKTDPSGKLPIFAQHRELLKTRAVLPSNVEPFFSCLGEKKRNCLDLIRTEAPSVTEVPRRAEPPRQPERPVPIEPKHQGEPLPASPPRKSRPVPAIPID